MNLTNFLATSGRMVALVLAAATLQTAVFAQSVVRCDSSGTRRKYCSVNTSGGVNMRYQYSQQGCWQNQTWGYDNNGIWVSNGCRADFTLGSPRSTEDNGGGGKLITGLILGAIAGAAVSGAVSNRDNNYDNNNDNYDGYRNTVRCESNDMGYHRCSVGRVGYAEIARQFSGSPCEHGRTWGYNRNFIWVDRGCRADFWVR